MTLETTILNTAEVAAAWAAKDDITVLDLLNKEYVLPDTRSWTLAALGEHVGVLLGDPEMGVYARRLFAGTMEAAVEMKVPGYAELKMAGYAMAGDGLTLYSEDRQEVIKALGAKWPPEILAAVLACGQRPTTLAREAIGRNAEQADLDDIRNQGERARRQGITQEAMLSVYDQITHETKRDEILSLIDAALGAF